MALLDFSPDGSTMSGIDHTPPFGSTPKTCSKMTVGEAVNGSKLTPSTAVFLYAICDSGLICGFIVIKFSPAPTPIDRIFLWVKGKNERLLSGSLSQVRPSVRRKQRQRVGVEACRAPTGNQFVVDRTSGEAAGWFKELGVTLRFAIEDRGVSRRLGDRLVSINHVLIAQSSLHDRTLGATRCDSGRSCDRHGHLRADDVRPR